MRAVVAAAILLIATTAATAQDRSRLISIDREFGLLAPYPGMHAYNLALRDGLLGTRARRSCEAIVVASFEREWSVYLQPSREGHEVVYTVMKEQLWGRMEEVAERSAQRSGLSYADAERSALAKASKDTWRFSAPLSATTARALERLWSAMLARAGELVESRCIDGTSYYLFQWSPDGGSRGGWGRCPLEGATGAVLQILEDLRKAAGSSSTGLIRQDMAIAVKATRLLRDME